jgi:hypothetical protein
VRQRAVAPVEKGVREPAPLPRSPPMTAVEKGGVSTSSEKAGEKRRKEKRAKDEPVASEAAFPTAAVASLRTEAAAEVAVCSAPTAFEVALVQRRRKEEYGVSRVTKDRRKKRRNALVVDTLGDRSDL